MGIRTSPWWAALLFFTAAANAQEAGAPHHEEKEAKRIEADFFASDVFRSATLAFRMWKGLAFEGHYFHVSGRDIGIVGGNWGFAWKGLEILPGAGAAFGGSEVKATPVLTLRWLYETPRFLTEGMIVQSLSKSRVTDEHTHEQREFYATLADNVHASARIHWFEIGPTFERIQYREENEVKWGGRVAVRPHQRISLVFMVLAPGETEYRGGIVFR